ncbi:aminotransferase class I/II-fold pyridoxal phosphate-dependent enzyme [Nonomuraea sp. PA05]|uniref:aminotransferase class I/II-fold pyridoxal phosphate-dependent enzyme n=1 Tax=Nonomuraea sp. PA05 TaxID=2604466 RepID=UPI0011DAD81C|nr:aminotransferase class I/II-fold pyridoxal phosphate-dependent enzyme [Nonomuraea sp. PA05]TYB69202.1 aminotransferase class I/II-fold pyridoxal phosphate-dependent enzyme [Nonomuraea sp. PA05]
MTLLRSTPSAFERLRALLANVPAPAGRTPIPLHLGEARLVTPPVDGRLLGDVAGWTRYPPLGGTPELRAAYTGWLTRRFGGHVAVAVRDGSLAIEPSPGTKQAVAAAIALSVTALAPAVVLPNPFYPTYHAATETSGGRAVFYAHADELAATVAGRRDVGAVVLCSPGNPRGETHPPGRLREIAAAAREAGALLVVDECYIDLVHGAPSGGGFLASGVAGEAGRFLVLHTLSKRSGMPGLRSGFVIGDPASVAAYAAHNRACGVSTAEPVCAVAARLWADDAHVARLRSAVSANWDVADDLLGDLPGYRRAEAGFFLWLPVPDDEEAARRLWREEAVMTMPGRYLGAGSEGDPGAGTGVNPGAGHLRIALVQAQDRTREALTRVRRALTTTAWELTG